MSAIFGVVRFDGAEVSARDLERMARTMSHRARDGYKCLAGSGAGLGHGLTRVNQEDRFEAQPLVDTAAGLTLVADCRIDNREDLAAAFGLSPADTETMPDSRFILLAYKKWGEDCPEHLLGDFAFAVWDAPARKLVLVRDHMGQRFVHYHLGKDFFAFATEVKALWALPGVPREISQSFFEKQILFDRTPSEGGTMFEDIWGLAGATTLTVTPDGETSKKTYWQPHPDPAHQGHDEAYYLTNFRRVFEEIVSCRVRRLIAPPALMLSAGFDSGAIAGLCGPILAAKGMKLMTLTSVVPEDSPHNAFCPRRWVEACRRVMPHLDVRYFVVSEKPFFTDMERHMPGSDGIAHGLRHLDHAMFQAAENGGARLLMDGFGGDNTLNTRGWDVMAYLLRSGRLRQFFAELFRGRNGRSVWHILLHEILRSFLPLWLLRWQKFARRGFVPLWKKNAVAPSFAGPLIASGKIDPSEGAWGVIDTAESAAMLRQVARHARQPLCLEAAAHGLDLTRPLRDKRSVEFGLAIPRALQLKNGHNRALARRALADIYPPEFQTRNWIQDHRLPGMTAMFAANAPLLKQELAKIAADPQMQRYYDYDALQAYLSDPRALRRPGDGRMISVMHAIEAGRYLRWFSGRND